LTMERALLYKRIEARIDLMLQQGWVDEVRRLQALGYTDETVSMQALGYKQLLQYIEGKMTLDEAVTLIKRDTRRFAKRQLSWFRRMQAIHWFDLTVREKYDSILNEINAIIAGKY